MTDAPKRVSVLDLTVDQIEALETELGKPVDQWGELPSRAQVYRRVYATVTGTDAATVGAMTMRQIIASVDMGEDTEDAETANPTGNASG